MKRLTSFQIVIETVTVTEGYSTADRPFLNEGSWTIQALIDKELVDKELPLKSKDRMNLG